jgi:hypothetical protein
MRWSSMHPGSSAFFSVGGDRGCWISHCAPIVVPYGFTTCSSNSQYVPQHVPSSLSLYLLSFALSSTLVIWSNPHYYYTYNIKIP